MRECGVMVPLQGKRLRYSSTLQTELASTIDRATWYIRGLRHVQCNVPSYTPAIRDEGKAC